MKKIISASTASIGIIIILSLLIIFHLLVLVDIVPYQVVWGGRIESKSQLSKFEIFSVCINLFMILLVCVKSGFLKILMNQKVLQISLWLMCVLFVLNTIGNLLSVNMIEKIVFTPITIILAFLSLRLAIAK